MKCMMSVDNKHIRRVTNEKASELYHEGGWRYVSKSLWKIIDKIADRGEAGNRSHITLVEKGFAPTEEIASLKGAMGEVRGEHRNRSGSRWEEFTNQIKTKGIQDRIFITVDHNGPAQIAEGNHRIDAAVELGMKQVPVEIRYFGKADKEGLLSERGLGGLPVKKYQLIYLGI